MDHTDPIETAKRVLLREEQDNAHEDVFEDNTEEVWEALARAAVKEDDDEDEDDEDEDEDDEDKVEGKKVKEGKLPPWLKKKSKKGDDDSDDDDDDDEDANEETILDVDDNQDAEGKKATDTPKGKKKMKDPKAKGSSASKKTGVVPAKEHLEILFAASGDDLSEEFKSAAATIFEAAVSNQVEAIQDELREEFNTAMVSHTEKITEELTERLDDYLNYVVEEWMKDNELAVEGGIKTEIAESFIGGLRDLFESNSITIPDENYEILEGVVDKAESLATDLNAEIEKNIELRKELTETRCSNVFHDVSDGLVDTEIEKLRSLSKGVEFDSVEQYEEKLNVLKESYFGDTTNANWNEEDTTTPDPTVKYTENGTIMDNYVNSIDRTQRG